MMLKKAASAGVAARAARPALPKIASRQATVVRASANGQQQEATAQVSKAVALATAATTLFSAGNALAASELMTVAAGDSRANILLTLLVPVVGWVGFNVLQPAQNQLARMDEMREGSKRGVAAVVGLGAAGLLAAGSAEAATEIAQVADARVSSLLTLLVPVLGWVLFNVLQPAQNQLARMDEMREGKRRSVIGAAGLGAAASLLLAGNAEAATEIAQVADGRVNILLTLLVPVIGWVLFNAGQPLLNQLDRMDEMRDGGKRRSVVGAAGLGAAATLLLAGNAEAATEIAQVADGRVNILLTLLVPVIGWVLFNAGQPLLNQLDRMDEMRDGGKRRSVVGAAGLGAAATLLLAGNAEAATEIAQVADGRVNILLTLLVPVIGWVLFNAGQPLLNQLDRMDEMRDGGKRK